MPQSFKNAKSMTEIHGYLPLAKRVAMLQSSGIKTMAHKDEMYDSVRVINQDRKGRKFIGEEVGRGVEEAPLFPRHMVPDLADVSEAFRVYSEKRDAVRARIKAEKFEAKVKAEAKLPPEGSKGPPVPLPSETNPKPA